MRQHRAREIFFRERERDQEGTKSQLRDEGKGFEMEVAGAGPRGRRGREVEKGIVRGEVVPMVDSGKVVEEGVRQKGGRVEAVHEKIE